MYANPGLGTMGVMGSSLGGVVSFYMGWEWLEVLGNVCLPVHPQRQSAGERVLREDRRDVRYCIDIGWPSDNYEVGQAVAVALAERGYRYGIDFLYFAFPNAEHSERDWRQRLSFQFFAGQPAVIPGLGKAPLGWHRRRRRCATRLGSVGC